MEQIVALSFKLRMFGVPGNGSAYVLCDNLIVVSNSSKIESTLNKKHLSVVYHACDKTPFITNINLKFDI